MNAAGILIHTFLQTENTQEPAAPIENTPDIGTLLEPDPVAFSFETPGWYILAGILLMSLILFFVRWLRNYRKNAYRREAVKQLSAIQNSTEGSAIGSSLQQLLTLLKIVAIQTYGRPAVAPLYGKNWLSFLQGKGKDTPFIEYESAIINALHAGKAVDRQEMEALFSLSKRWILTHA